MTINKCKFSRPLKDGECGGCGTFENVTDNCCVECAKGYIDPTPADIADANEYYENHIRPLVKIVDEVPQLDSAQMWKKLRAPVDYSLEAELERAEAQEVSIYEYGADITSRLGHIPETVEDYGPRFAVGITGCKLIDLYADKEMNVATPTKFNLEGLNEAIGEGGFKQGELVVIGSPNLLKP